MGRSGRLLAIIGSVVIVTAGLAVTVAQGSSPQCVSLLAGTYHKQGDFLLTLQADGSVTGQYSEASQTGAAGNGETFTGGWKCNGYHLTVTQYRFFDQGGTPYVERGVATGSFDAIALLSLTYTFHVFPESVNSNALRAAAGTVVHVPPLQMWRIWPS
jgi:hypothetical protein